MGVPIAAYVERILKNSRLFSMVSKPFRTSVTVNSSSSIVDKRRLASSMTQSEQIIIEIL